MSAEEDPASPEGRSAGRRERLQRVPHILALVSLLPALTRGAEDAGSVGTTLAGLLAAANLLALLAPKRWPVALPVLVHLCNAAANLEFAWRLHASGTDAVHLLHALAGLLFLGVALLQLRRRDRPVQAEASST